MARPRLDQRFVLSGNFIAARVRRRAGHRLDSSALIAAGDHAAANAYVSLAVIASAIVVVGVLPIADPLSGLATTAIILRITWVLEHLARARPSPLSHVGRRKTVAAGYHRLSLRGVS